MGYLELSTTELAKIVSSAFAVDITNAKGLSNGISFDIEPGIKLLPKTIPLKIVFVEFDDENEILIFEILPNKDSRILRKSFGLMMKTLPKLLSDDMPEGIELENNYLYIMPSEMFYQPGVEIYITDAKLKSRKLQISFDIDYE